MQHEGTAATKRSDIHLETAVVFYIFGALFLEIQLPNTGFNLGNLFMVAGCVLTVWSAANARRRVGVKGIRIAPHDWIYGAYLGFCLVSALWSPSPVDTIIQVFYLGALWIAAMNLADAGVKTVVRALVIVVPIVAFLSLLMVVVAPENAFQSYSSSGVPELRGIFTHQQRLGLLMALTLGACLLAYANDEGKELVGRFLGIGGVRLLLIGACLVAAAARSYTAFMIIAVVLTWGVSRRDWRRWVSLAAMAYGVVFIALNLEMILGLFADSEADLTLTGRTFIWERTVSVANEAPILGHGYASFFNGAYNYMWPSFRPGHANNSFINAYFETGLVGALLVLGVMFLHLRTSLRISGKQRKYTYALFIVVLSILASQTGVTYAGKPSVLFAICLLFLSVEAQTVRLATRETPVVDSPAHATNSLAQRRLGMPV